MSSQSVILMNTISDYSNFPHNLKAVPLIQRSSTTFQASKSPSLIRINGEVDNSKSMSLAFREVYKEFSSESRKQSKDPANDKISDVFHIGDKLLLSNDNMRPKSRSKTCINGQDFHKVTPCDGDVRRQHSNSASTTLHRYLTEDISLKSHNDVLSPLSNKEIRDNSNNAQDGLELHIDSVKKGKRSKKRSNLNNKAKKGKHGRILATANGLQERRIPGQGQNSSTNTQHLKSRVSSEPPSKAAQSSVVSYTLLDTAYGNTQNHISNSSSTNVKLHDMYPLRVASAKTNSDTLPSTHYMHGNITCNPVLNNLNSTQCIEAHGQSVLLYKFDMNSRVKSASSLKSDSVSQVNSLKSGVSDVTTITTEELALNAVSCNIQKHNKPNKTVTKYYQQKSIQSNDGLSTDNVSKEALLTSIYDAVYQTADLVTAQVEELKKVKKIFLSEKQSGTLREGGMEFPCAPPATPTPDLLRKHEFVPSMSDIRAQRAVKSRLQVMEKEAMRKQEKKKEAHSKLEKQQMKDRDKLIKAKQRREIYALNKIMTELENKRFLEFCQAKGLNKV